MLSTNDGVFLMVSDCAVRFYTPTVVALDKWTGGLAWHSGGLRTTMRRVGFKINTLAVVSRRTAGHCCFYRPICRRCRQRRRRRRAAVATTMTTTRDGCRLVSFCPRSDRHDCCRRPPVYRPADAYYTNKLL